MLSIPARRPKSYKDWMELVVSYFSFRGFFQEPYTLKQKLNSKAAALLVGTATLFKKGS